MDLALPNWGEGGRGGIVMGQPRTSAKEFIIGGASSLLCVAVDGKALG